MAVLNRPICLHEKDNVSDLESGRSAGLKACVWSNLCTRHIPKKLTPRGHEDWPDKRATRTERAEGRRAGSALAWCSGRYLLISVAIAGSAASRWWRSLSGSFRGRRVDREVLVIHNGSVCIDEVHGHHHRLANHRPNTRFQLFQTPSETSPDHLRDLRSAAACGCAGSASTGKVVNPPVQFLGRRLARAVVVPVQPNHLENSAVWPQSPFARRIL
jgi:hypothetical protein